MQDYELTDIDRTKYHTAATICGKVYNRLKHLIKNENKRDIRELSDLGNNMIIEELSFIYKKESNKHVGFPVSISLNNCVGNYVYDDNPEYNLIMEDSVIKIELGVSISGCISILAETFTINDNPSVNRINMFLDKLKKDIVEKIRDEETSDEIRMYIESKCVSNDVFPIENCTSYQNANGFLNTEDSKYMILNYKKYYDKNEYLITPENINYEFEKNDVYTINLTVIPGEHDTVKYTLGESHLYKFNEFNYSLKLKNSHAFYKDAKYKNDHHPFEITEYLKNVRHRVGIKECLDNGILEKLKLSFVNPDKFVVTKKFTIIVGDSESKLLKY